MTPRHFHFIALVAAAIVGAAGCNETEENAATDGETGYGYSAEASSTTREALGVVSWSVDWGRNGTRIAGRDGTVKTVLAWQTERSDAGVRYDLAYRGRTASIVFARVDGALDLQENTFPGDAELSDAMSRVAADLSENEHRAKTLPVSAKSIAPRDLTRGDQPKLVTDCSAQQGEVDRIERENGAKCTVCSPNGWRMSLHDINGAFFRECGPCNDGLEALEEASERLDACNGTRCSVAPEICKAAWEGYERSRTVVR